MLGGLRRVQTFLRTLGIEIVFGREAVGECGPSDNGHGREPNPRHHQHRLAVSATMEIGRV